MKVLIFEYITGGGLNKQALPDSLLSEGRLMLAALVDNFSRLKQIDLVVMLDARLVGAIELPGVEIVSIGVLEDSHAAFEQLIPYCDAVWPIAPESDGILATLCRSVAAQAKPLLTSPADAVMQTANKYTVYQQLNRHHIATVPTQHLSAAQYEFGDWVVKPIDGAGCAGTRIVADRQDFEGIRSTKGTVQLIIQPHLHGQKTSLSCLFKGGRVWLLCVNLQQFDIVNKHYKLTGISVNHQLADNHGYQQIIDGIARAFPCLWGYAGVDLIETPEQLWVLEINPRLTTSFVGIYAALGINVAEQVLRLLNGEPCWRSSANQAISITIGQGCL
ncbi:MAG: ATP-grasp domain-containing protein [Methylovulum sp.]|nr:ATP-grasp domain-containing protein [Methylovulum sp.]